MQLLQAFQSLLSLWGYRRRVEETESLAHVSDTQSRHYSHLRPLVVLEGWLGVGELVLTWRADLRTGVRGLDLSGVPS